MKNRSLIYFFIIYLAGLNCDSSLLIGKKIKDCIIDNTSYSVQLEKATNLLEIVEKLESNLIQANYLGDESLVSYQNLYKNLDTLSIEERSKMMKEIYFPELEGLNAPSTYNSSIHCYEAGKELEDSIFFEKVTNMLAYGTYDNLAVDLLNHDYIKFDEIIYRAPILYIFFLKMEGVSG